MMNRTAGTSEHVQKSLQVVPATQESQMPAPADTVASSPRPDSDEFDMATALVRLLVGLALEGTDELAARLRVWDAAVRAAEPAPPPAAARAAWPDPRRSALIGMVFAAQQRVSEGVAALARFADETGRTVTARLAPALRLTPFDPMMEYLYERYREWMERVDRLTALGRIEEYEARLLARKALPGLIDRALDIVTKNPDVRALLQQQGADVAKSALDEARERVGGADALAERIAHTLLRRPKSAGAAPSQRAQSDGAGSDDANGTYSADGTHGANSAHGVR